MGKALFAVGGMSVEVLYLPIAGVWHRMFKVFRFRVPRGFLKSATKWCLRLARHVERRQEVVVRMYRSRKHRRLFMLAVAVPLARRSSSVIAQVVGVVFERRRRSSAKWLDFLEQHYQRCGHFLDVLADVVRERQDVLSRVGMLAVRAVRVERNALEALQEYLAYLVLGRVAAGHG